MAGLPTSVESYATERQQQAEYSPSITVESAQVRESGVPSTLAEPHSSSLFPVYGTMGQRFTSYFADLIVIYFITILFYVAVTAFELPIASDGIEPQLVWLGILIVYMIVAQAAYHTTLGKYVHGLEVCSANTNRKYPAFWRILLRESLGRMLCSLLWGMGYWMAIKKPKVQAWSDELAGTVVTVRPTNRVLVRALTAFILVTLILDVSLTGYGFYKEDRDKRYAALQKEMDTAGNAVVAARTNVDDRLNSEPALNTWADFAAWQDSMKSLQHDLDVYEARIDHVQELLQKGISENLAASEAERKQLVALRRVYDLRRQQAEKMRQETNLIINCPPTQSSYASLKNDLKLLDSDIAGLDHQASQLLAEANIK
jgi:uncharacterized RDD family membrane protein YckC